MTTKSAMITKNRNLPKIYSAEFWAREVSMPLFWMTDPKKSYGTDSIIIFHGGIFHFYYLNGSEKVRAEDSILKTKRGRSEYIKRANTFLVRSELFVKNFGKGKAKNFTKEELSENFKEALGYLHDYGDLYRHTEEAASTNVIDITAKEAEEIGQIRFRFRKKGFELFSILVGKVLREVSRRHKISIKPDMFLYTYDEIVSLLSKDKVVGKDILDSRRNALAVRRRGSKADAYFGKQAQDIWKLVQDKLKKDTNTKELKGMIAYAGKVAGRVHVVFERRDKEAGFYKFKDGEILVTDMTKPDMISLCKKAAAIITDEGGILSHAAIIARELKKPCIIGTKEATQILKDGDMVEVDASFDEEGRRIDNGTVRLIESKQ
ncbi:MAG: PEP-utilizing enzyme [Candidatus Paceibacterota bacterium]|jgi:phosphohistidine swiveling domain-containing protein